VGAGGSAGDAGDSAVGGAAEDGGSTGGADGAAGVGGAGGGNSGPSWTWLRQSIGNTPVTNVTIDGSGNAFASLAAPNTAVYSGGIFRSADNGASWQPRNFGIYGLTNIRSLAASGNTVYAITVGQILNSMLLAIFPRPILIRSTDDGASWSEVTPLTANPFGLGVLRTSGSLVAMTTGLPTGLGVSVSTDEGNTFNAAPCGSVNDIAVVGRSILCSGAGGVSRSADGGATFGLAQGFDAGSSAGQVLCDGASTCYAVISTTGAQYPSLFKSVDEGATWDLARTEVGGIRAVATVVVYVTKAITGQPIRSDDGGQTWTLTDSPDDTCPNGFAAQGEKVFAACNGGVYRSDDRGVSWNSASGSAETGALTSNVLGVFVDTSPTAVGADGDIYAYTPNLANAYSPNLRRSSDGGNTWQLLVPQGGGLLDAPSCVVTEMGALECVNNQFGLVRSTDHGETWQPVALPMFFLAGFAQNAGSTVYLFSYGDSRSERTLARSDDDGLTFQVLEGSQPYFGGAKKVQVLRNGHVLNQSGASTSRSVDGGETWQTLPMFSIYLWSRTRAAASSTSTMEE